MRVACYAVQIALLATWLLIFFHDPSLPGALTILIIGFMLGFMVGHDMTWPNVVGWRSRAEEWRRLATRVISEYQELAALYSKAVEFINDDGEEWKRGVVDED